MKINGIQTPSYNTMNNQDDRNDPKKRRTIQTVPRELEQTMTTPSIRQDVPHPIEQTGKVELGIELTDLDIDQLAIKDQNKQKQDENLLDLPEDSKVDE